MGFDRTLRRRERLIAWPGLVATVLSVLLMAAAMLALVFAAEHFEGRPEIVDADSFLSVRLRGGEGHPHRS